MTRVARASAFLDGDQAGDNAGSTYSKFIPNITFSCHMSEAMECLTCKIILK